MAIPFVEVLVEVLESSKPVKGYEIDDTVMAVMWSCVMNLSNEKAPVRKEGEELPLLGSKAIRMRSLFAFQRFFRKSQVKKDQSSGD